MSKTIYIVDDDAAVRDSVQVLLDTHGYCAKAFESACEFLSRYEGEPACLLLDINMPSMGGIELLKIVQRRWAQLSVIMMTGRQESLSGAQADLPPGVGLLAKPFHDRALVAAINTAATQRLN
jgi:two-component system, LuxR family, response regulator FixJ